MLNETPGAYIWLSAARESDDSKLRSPHFDFSDAVQPTSAKIWVRLARQDLA